MICGRAYRPMVVNLQVRSVGLGSLLAMLPSAAVGFLAFPVAVAVYALTLIGLSASMKALLVGKITPNVHK
jgi:hypothetical protein